MSSIDDGHAGHGFDGHAEGAAYTHGWLAAVVCQLLVAGQEKEGAINKENHLFGLWSVYWAIRSQNPHDISICLYSLIYFMH